MEYAPCHNTSDVPNPSMYWRKATDIMITRIKSKTNVLFVPVQDMSGVSRKYFRDCSDAAKIRRADGVHYYVHCRENDDMLCFKTLHDKVIDFVVEKTELDDVHLQVCNAFTATLDCNIVVKKSATLKTAVCEAKDLLTRMGKLSAPTKVK